MPLVNTQRRYVSNLVKGTPHYEMTNAMNFITDGITVTNRNNGSGTITTADIQSIGVPVIFDSANDEWVIFNDNDADIAGAITADDSTLPNRAPIALLVGDRFGYGYNTEDITLDANGEPFTALFRGDGTVGVVSSGIDWAAGGVTTSQANQDAFVEQLEKQQIQVIDNATAIVPTYDS